MAAAILIVAATGNVGGVSAGQLEDALAQDWFWSPTPSYPQAKFRRPKPLQKKDADKENKDQERARLLFSSGFDLWRHAAFAYDAMLWTPFGEGNDGLIFKAVTTAGYYRYRAGSLGGAEVIGRMVGAAAMPGAQFTRGGVSVATYFGVDVQGHILSPFDPGNDLQGRYVGLRMAVDLWTEPTPQTMIVASATLSTIGGQYAVRAAGGWRVFGWCYLGPEVIAYGGPEYRQVRFGVHATGLRTSLFNVRLEWQGGIGYAFDDDKNEGVYARFGVLWRH